MYTSDDLFIGVIDESNALSPLKKCFRVRNLSTGALMKANIGGLIRAVRLENVEIKFNSSADFIELASQAQRYKFRTIFEVLGFLKLMTREDSLFKQERVSDFLADYVDSLFCKEELKSFTVPDLNLILGGDYIRMQAGDEPFAIWIGNYPVWTGAKLNAAAYTALVTLQPKQTRLFQKVVLRP